MSQPELTVSFKKLVGMIKSQPSDETTEAGVMSERICQGAIVQKSTQSGETLAANGADAQAHELIKDVYMDALIACDSRECMEQLLKIINSNQVDTIRASYYMTRMAVAEKDTIKDESEVKQWAESFVKQQLGEPSSEAIERQKLFATTSVLGKFLKNKCEQPEQCQTLKQTVQQVAETIVQRYIKPVSQQEVQQYQQQQQQQPDEQIAKKIAKRNAALKALANIPGAHLAQIKPIEEILMTLAENKQELVTVRQSAIECLEQNEQVYGQLKQITFDQEEPIEVRVAALRTIMTVVWAGKGKQEQSKQQLAAEIVDQLVKHCESERNQQQDDQFVLYAISYLDNLRTSQQPEHEAIKECISKNKQHYMQIQLLCKKFKQQLNDITKSSRNYKLEQEFNQLESGLIIEGDLIYASKKQQQREQMLPKLIRVNMSMPIMGETVNVVEITVRQNDMDEQLLSTLKLVKDAKFNSESVSKVVDSFKSSVEQTKQRTGINNKPTATEADLTIKVDGCTVVYVCVDDFKSAAGQQQHQRNTRSVYSSYSIVDEILQHLKSNPVSFNRGFNFNFNERLAKALDVDANIIAGLRFESRASGQSAKDLEIVAHIEPRFAFEAIVGPAKVSSKKLLQRLSTKTALGLRLRFKSDELVDIQVDLPMNTMELFTFETQMVEKHASSPYAYTYLADSIYGQEDIYSPEEELYNTEYASVAATGIRKIKRSIFESSKKSNKQSVMRFIQGKSYYSFAHSLEIPEEVARATGLRGKLRVVASPKDMSFLVQAVCQKYEPQMQGYRVLVQKVQRGAEQQQVIFTLSTPGSRVDRTVQWRAIVQKGQQRTLVKSDIQSPMVSGTMQLELIHDGRQFAIKTELASLDKRAPSHKQWRHLFECGVQRGSQSQAGRVATTYKPYVNIDSTYLRRPVQMQGVVSFQQTPKTVISWELKCPTSSNYVQAKVIVDQRSTSTFSRRSLQRAMQSPLELLLKNDLTISAELVGQIEQQAVKVRHMIDWDAQKFNLNSDLAVSHKNLRKSHEQQFVGSVKLNQDQQVYSLERRCPQDERKQFRMTIASDCTLAAGHQLDAELRYKRNSVVAYKHKVQVNEISAKKYDATYQVELIASEHQLNEKIVGRTEMAFERKVKSLRTELATGSRNKSAKLEVEFESLEKHHVELNIQDDKRQFAHKTEVRADQRHFGLQSRTDKRGQMVAKCVVEIEKQLGECQLLVEYPIENVHVAVDLKPASGKMSSVAVQTGRFVGKTEFAFQTVGKRANWLSKQMLPGLSQLRFKSDLKDLLKQEQYWIESELGLDAQNKPTSYLRFDSPLYRSDLEFDSRDKSAKIGMFGRAKRSVANWNQLYSEEESLFKQQPAFDTKMNLGDKLWMVRSMVAANKLDQLKKQARRALFEYADRRQSHKHQVNYSPEEERINFNFERLPSQLEVVEFQPLRVSGDLATNYYSQRQQRPSTLSMDSEWMELELGAKPFDGEESYAKVSALSRLPRAAFKKHESEIRYKKNEGYKAWMKHQDSKDQKHAWQVEADESPRKFAKLTMESDKLGKAHYEHNWRKHTNKRANKNQEEVFANRVQFETESPRSQWSQRTDFQWEEPMVFGGRVRRDVRDELDQVAGEAQSRYNTLDYLNHISARLNSQVSKNQAELYNVDFDYLPKSHARLSVQMPDEMLHQSSVELMPVERSLKLQSKLVNLRTNKPTYELFAATKPSLVAGLAGAEQEPVFINDQHPMLARPISNKLATSLFRQPLKLDYSDNYGRQMRFDYDQSPLVTVGQEQYQGLRQKRAALYFKDDSADFEHESTYDFYPERLLSGGFKQGVKRVPGDFAAKLSTKYGPVVMRVESDDNTVECQLQSPLFNAKLTGETYSQNKPALFKLNLDNKNQSVKLTKIIRATPIIQDCGLIHQIAQKIDQNRIQHQTELLVSIVENIFKIKSQTMKNERPVLLIEGEMNKQEKLVVKINGERAKGQIVCDLITGTTQLVMDVDDKRTVQHQTRIVRASDKFFTVESMTTYKQQPLFKLSGKISSQILSEPMHLFATGNHYSRRNMYTEEHISTFDATIFEPTKVQVTGQYDCLNKEVRMIVKDVENKKSTEVRVQYDEQTENIKVDARCTTPRGIDYQIHKNIDINRLVSVY